MNATLTLVSGLLLGTVALGAIATVIAVEESAESGPGAENRSYGDGRAETLVPVPADPRATYVLISMQRRADGLREIATRRHGPEGERWALHLVQCAPYRAGYMAEGGTAAALRVRDEAPALGVVVAGSITDAIAQFACQGA